MYPLGVEDLEPEMATFLYLRHVRQGTALAVPQVLALYVASAAEELILWRFW